MVISKQQAKRAGKDFEVKTAHELIDNGYRVIMSAGSAGDADLVAVKHREVLFVQCKAGVGWSGSPGLVSPGERRGLLDLAGRLPGVGRAIVAYQARQGRQHVRLYRELTGQEPGQSRAWTPDEVIRDG